MLSGETHIARLRHFVPLVDKVVWEAKQRVFAGNQHVAGKILSLFELHSQVIRKGKAHKPNEFGRLVRVDDVQNGIVSGYEVLESNVLDARGFMPAVKQHQWAIKMDWLIICSSARGGGVHRGNSQEKRRGAAAAAPHLPQAAATPPRACHRERDRSS